MIQIYDTINILIGEINFERIKAKLLNYYLKTRKMVKSCLLYVFFFYLLERKDSFSSDTVTPPLYVGT